MSVARFAKVPVVEVIDTEKIAGQGDNAQSLISPQFQKLHEQDLVRAPSIHV